MLPGEPLLPSVRAAARRYVPGVSGIFEVLQKFFWRPKKASTDQPTEAEIKHDVNALLHGRKEGRIVIENKLPDTKKGKRTIIDETDKNKRMNNKLKAPLNPPEDRWYCPYFW